jgi:hypothetical protein
VSCSWVDPHFAALSARREEERLAERLAAQLRARSVPEPFRNPSDRREPGWVEPDAAVHGGHLRPL